jgi:hypothetical protein
MEGVIVRSKIRQLSWARARLLYPLTGQPPAAFEEPAIEPVIA